MRLQCKIKSEKNYIQNFKKRSSKDSLKAIANPPAPPTGPHRCGSQATVADSWTAVPGPRLGGQGAWRAPAVPCTLVPRVTAVRRGCSRRPAFLGRWRFRLRPHLTTPGPPRGVTAGRAQLQARPPSHFQKPRMRQEEEPTRRREWPGRKVGVKTEGTRWKNEEGSLQDITLGAGFCPWRCPEQALGPPRRWSASVSSPGAGVPEHR